jgi:hypothetical protein
MLHAFAAWPFASWLATTSLSRLFQDVLWIIPVSQCIHIVCISILFASAIAINLRLLGLWFLDRHVSELARGLLPWMWGSLAVLVITGFVQTVAEPVREFQSPFFWAKMTLLAIVVIFSAVFAGSVRANAERWDAAVTRPAAARAFALASSVLWIGIIVFGRLIAYTWILPQAQ